MTSPTIDTIGQVSVWKPMCTNATICQLYVWERNSHPVQIGAMFFLFKDLTQRTTSWRWTAVASDNCLPSNIFGNNTVSEKHDALKLLIYGCKTNRFAVQASPPKFCKCQSNLELIAVSFLLSFSFCCFNTDLFVIFPWCFACFTRIAGTLIRNMANNLWVVFTQIDCLWKKPNSMANSIGPVAPPWQPLAQTSPPFCKQISQGLQGPRGPRRTLPPPCLHPHSDERRHVWNTSPGTSPITKS